MSAIGLKSMGSRLYSENARVCAKWQWNARDCVTGLHDRRSRGVQSSNNSRVRFNVISHTPVRSRLYHIHIVYKRNWDGSYLMNLTQKSYSWFHIFQIRNLFHCVAESRWNMPFKGSRHGNGVVDGAVAKLLRLWQHASALWRHAVRIRIVMSTMHEWVMNIHYHTWIAQGRFINMIRTPSKQWGACGNLLSRMFKRRSKKTSKLRVTGLCDGNSRVTGEFPAQRASNAENVSIWWRHHALNKIDKWRVRHHLLYYGVALVCSHNE